MVGIVLVRVWQAYCKISRGRKSESALLLQATNQGNKAGQKMKTSSWYPFGKSDANAAVASNDSPHTRIRLSPKGRFLYFTKDVDEQ